MIKPKQAIAGAMTALLLLATACGGPEENPPDSALPLASQGRYLERDVTPQTESPELQVFPKADGGFVCFSADLASRYDSSDGETWAQSPGPAIPEAHSFSYDPEEDAVVAFITGEEATGIYKIQSDGSKEQIPLAEFDSLVAEGKEPQVINLQVFPQNRLLLSYFYGEYSGMVFASEESASEPSLPDEPGEGKGLYDLQTGALVCDLSDWMGYTCAADANTLYLLSYDGTIQTHNLADGSPGEGNAQIPEENAMRIQAMLPSEEGQLDFVDSRALTRLDLHSNTLEEILNGSSYAFGNPAGYIEALFGLPGGGYLMNLNDGTGSRLYKYAWDENATIDPAQTLRIWSLEDNQTVRAAINAFRRENPDAVIHFETALTGDGNQTAEDAIRALNTQMLAGNAPDVLILDGCPAESYENKGMLKDLSAIVDASDLYEAVADAFVKEEGTYLLAARAKLPLLVGSDASISSVGTLQDLVAAAVDGAGNPPVSEEQEFTSLPEEERPFLSFGDWSEMFSMLYDTSSSAMIQDNKLNTESLREFLSALKSLTDKYELTEENAQQAGMAVVTTGGSEASIAGSAVNYAMGRALSGAMISHDLLLTQMMMQPPGSLAKPFPGLAENPWIPATLVGVSADSKVPELAENFVRTMFSEEVQSSPVLGSGYPVSKSGMAASLASLDEGEMNIDGRNTDFDFEAVFSALQTPVFTEDVLMEKIKAVSQEYCSDTVDLDTAVNQIEQQVQNYLAERS